MDLRHARTFVTVAELGTVSKAALRLRIAQPALSRQISALEQELGFKLFDRAGRGLVLTGEGEQLLSDCRGLLNYAAALGERAQLLRRGDTGVLKVAAGPQFIDGVMSNFLHHYKERFPNVQVKLIEAIGWSDIRGLLERGEIHLGQNLAHAVPAGDRRFASQLLEPVDQLAACHPKLTLGKRLAIEIERLAPHPLLMLDTSYIFRKTFDAACQPRGASAQYCIRKPDATHTAGDGRRRARRGNHPVDLAGASLCVADRQRDLPGKTAARAIGGVLGQAAAVAGLRDGVLPDAGDTCPRDISDHAPVCTQGWCGGEADHDAPVAPAPCAVIPIGHSKFR